MKPLICTLAIFSVITSCNNIKVTANPDNHTATSGTLGSARHTNQLPDRADTTRRADTLKIIKDTIPR